MHLYKMVIMRYWRTFGLFVALISFQMTATAQSLEGFDPDAARRAATQAELDWLEHEIGRFASGDEAVFLGQMTVTERDKYGVTVLEGMVLASLSRASPAVLTVVFPKTGKWLRLTQTQFDPIETEVTRLRKPRSTGGVHARCRNCMPPLTEFGTNPIPLSLAAKGELLDVKRSEFGVELSGYLERISTKELDLKRILALRPDLASWIRRPVAKFEAKPNEFLRDVDAVLRQPAPAPGGDEERLTCAFETRYSAQHYVSRKDPARFGVRDLKLGDTVLCCVDLPSHDGSKVCDREY